MKTLVIFSVLLFFATFQCLADTPLTSTPFSNVYCNESIVAKALKVGGKIDAEMMEYLSGKNPIDLKVALINALGWDGEGRVNANIYIGHLMKIREYMTEEELKQKARPDELLCIAYLKAMDNYFDVSTAIVYADLAISKNEKSYTFQIIAALIKAQSEMDRDWCTVYWLSDKVRQNLDLKMDFKSEASKIIFQFMDGYKEYCKK